MFWKKKSETKKPEESSARIQVIPEAFYGAKDPAVHYKPRLEVATPTADKVAVKQKESFGAAIHGVSGLNPIGFLKNRITRYIVLSSAFVAIVVGISVYYVNQAKQTAGLKQAAPADFLETTVAQKTAVPAADEEQITIPPLEGPSEAETGEEVVVEPTAQKLFLEFPETILIDSADLDNDSLTDWEEELFGTDSGKWDTDGDGYYDGQEVFNLYNPKGIAPIKLIDSGLIKEYIHPSLQYRLYYPSQWTEGAVYSDGTRMLFSALSGDHIEVVATKKEPGEYFSDWFAREVLGQQYSDLQRFTNRFGEDGWRRSDDLTAFFENSDSIYILIYHHGLTNSIPYRHIMQMLAQSFRPSKISAPLPEQPILPTEDGGGGVGEAELEISTPTEAGVGA